MERDAYITNQFNNERLTPHKMKNLRHRIHELSSVTCFPLNNSPDRVSYILRDRTGLSIRFRLSGVVNARMDISETI